MSSDHEAEIRASVGAHADLGSGYDDAVAEGLVERIGAEIDKRIDARLGQVGAMGASGPPAGQGDQAPVGYQGYQGYQGYMGPMLPPGYQMGPPPVRPSPTGQHHVATTVTALGSIALGVAATAVISHDNHSGGQAFMVLLIWIAIVIINVAYARRR
jgi:hypothetical protein